MRLGWFGATRKRLRHIWKKHKISERELEEAFGYPRFKPVYRRSRHGRYTVLSQTSAGRGITAVLEIVYSNKKSGMHIWEVHEDAPATDETKKGACGAFVITAREWTDPERKWFKEMCKER